MTVNPPTNRAGTATLGPLTLELSDDALEQLARRVADLLAASTDVEREPAGYLDVAAAATFLACPPSRIYALVSAGRIPHYRDGSRLLFLPCELRSFVRNGGAKRP